MNEANPFQTPQDADYFANRSDPSRPKPWSVLSLVATLVVLAFVAASWWFIREPPFTEMPPSQWSPFFDQVFIGVNILLLQAIVLGFWLGAGSTSILLRCFLGTLLISGLGWETVQLMGSYCWEIMIRIALVVAMLTAIVDTALLAISSRRTTKRLAGSVLMIVLAPLACGGVYWWAIVDFSDYYFSVEAAIPMATVLGVACCGTTAGVILLSWKHRFSRRSYLGCGAALIVTPVLVSLLVNTYGQGYRAAIPWFMLVAYELVSTVLLHSVHRVLRSYGGSLVPLPRPASPVSDEAEHG